MNVTIKPGLIRVTLKGKVFESKALGYYINGARVSLEQIPLRVRYIMAYAQVGRADL